MDKKTFEAEMGALLKKYGMKADDAEEAKPDSKPEEKADESKIVADMATKVAEKLAGIITAQKGITSEADKKSLDREFKNKIYTSWGGVKEVEYPSDLKSLGKDEKIVNFFKALVYAKNDPASQQVLRALSEGVDAEGGYLVPEELRTEVFRVLPDMTVMRKLARVIPMSTDTLKLNSLSARPVAYWTGEYQSKSTTSAEFNQVVLSPNDLVCLLPVTEQLLADANINLVQFITELFAEAIGLAEDQAFFTGSGSGQPKGITQETINSAGIAGASPTFDDVIDLIDMVPQRVTMSPKAAFIGHRKVKRQLRKVKDVDGNYIWRDGGSASNNTGETARLPSTLYGYPYYEVNFLPQSELYFGDWSMYIIGDRQTMSVQTTTEGGEAWRRNAMEIKAVERVDGRAVLTSPFAKVTGL